MRLLILVFLFISFKGISQGYIQCKTSVKSANGETINCVDQKDQRQGKWVIRKEGLRGEPGYDEEGIYIDGKKEGIWRLYTKMGDLFALESYKWGYKDGISQYFDMAGITREESWKAVNPANPYDTIDVPDPVTNKIQIRVIKLEGTALKHGKWKFYDSETGRIIKSENYFLDKLHDPNSFANNTTKAAADTATKKPVVKVKPPAVLEFEKKAGKKGIKVIDGRTGM